MERTIEDVKLVHEEEMKNYDRIQTKILSVMHAHGCKIIRPPVFEDYDTYGCYFPSLRREMIKTVDADGRVLVMRPDITVPLVKMISKEYPDGLQILKFGYVSTVFREYYGKSKHGKYFQQGGVEVFGDESPACDGEVISIAVEFLSALGISDIRIDIGTVAYIDALLEELHLPGKKLTEIHKCMEERNLVSFNVMIDTLPVTELQRPALLKIPTLFGDYREVIKRAYDAAINHKMKKALQRLGLVYDYLKAVGVEDKVQLDLGFTSHMGYYTDLVFKVYANKAPYSLISGGRYDGLSTQFGIVRPACGFGMNINLLYEFMKEENLIGQKEIFCDLAVIYDKPDCYIIRFLSRLRNRGYSVMGINSQNHIVKNEYKIVAYYQNRNFVVNGIGCTAADLDRILKGI